MSSGTNSPAHQQTKSKSLNSPLPKDGIINAELDDIETMDIAENDDKRKSISQPARRVSFASKTRVRLIGDSTPSKIPVPQRHQLQQLSPQQPPRSTATTTTSLAQVLLQQDQQDESSAGSSNMSLLSQQSLESDLRDPHMESSFSSYDESTLDHTSTDMDFTGPLPLHKKDPDSPLSVDTMELTTCVGGIMDSIRNPRPSTKSSLSITTTNTTTTTTLPNTAMPPLSDLNLLSSNALSDEELRDEDMEMTMIAYPPQPPTPTRDSFIANENLHLLYSPLRSMDANGDGGFGNDNNNNNNNNNINKNDDDEDDTLNSISYKSIPSTPLRRQVYSDQQQQQQQEEEEYIESPTVTSLLPRAQLSDFLQQTGIRFLDRLSTNLGRRETSGVPTMGLGDDWGTTTTTTTTDEDGPDSVDMDVLSLKKRAAQLGCDAGKEKLAQALSQTCSSLVEEIESLREVNLSLEGRFNHSPPVAFTLFHSSKKSDSDLVQSKLKTLKSISRLHARKAWYSWRQEKLHAPLNMILSQNHDVLFSQNNLLRQAQSKMISIDFIEEQEKLSSMALVLGSLKERLEFIKNGNGLLVLREKEADVQRSYSGLLEMKETHSSLKEKEDKLRSMLKERISLRDAVKKKLISLTTTSSGVSGGVCSEDNNNNHHHHNTHHTLTCLPNTLPYLEEMRSQLLLLNAVSGWTVQHVSSATGIKEHGIRLSDDHLNHVNHFNHDNNNQRIMKLLHNRSEITVQIAPGKAVTITRVPEAQLPFKEFIERSHCCSAFDGQLSLQKRLCLIGDNLDLMQSVTEELRGVGVLSKISTVGDEILLTISMYSPSPPSKYDILLLLSSSPVDGRVSLGFSQLLHFYGSVSGDKITSTIMECLDKPFSIKKIVSTLQTLSA